ncbi:3D domain protein [Listeria phage LIS04]|nr:3D domain protein [Listeria phage LIS04]
MSKYKKLRTSLYVFAILGAAVVPSAHLYMTSKELSNTNNKLSKLETKLDSTLQDLDKSKLTVKSQSLVLTELKSTNKKLVSNLNSLKETNKKLKLQLKDVKSKLKAERSQSTSNSSVASQTNAKPSSTKTHKLSSSNHKSSVKSTKRITAYTAGYESTGKSPGDKDYAIMASGYKVFDGAIAAGPSYAMGTLIKIPNVGWTIVLDRGGAISDDRIDLYVTSVSTAQTWGVKYLDVEIIPMTKSDTVASRVKMLHSMR